MQFISYGVPALWTFVQKSARTYYHFRSNLRTFRRAHKHLLDNIVNQHMLIMVPLRFNQLWFHHQMKRKLWLLLPRCPSPLLNFNVLAFKISFTSNTHMIEYERQGSWMTVSAPARWSGDWDSVLLGQIRDACGPGNN